MNVIALIGRVTKSETAALLGEDFSGWKLRKDNPSTPGSSLRGRRDRKRESFVLVCASLSDLEWASQLLAFEGQTRRMVVVVKETSRPDMVKLPTFFSSEGFEVSYRSHKNGFVISISSAEYSVDIGAAAASLVVPDKRLHSSTRVALQNSSMTGLVQPSRSPGIGMGSVPRTPDSIPPFDLFLTAADDAVEAIAQEDLNDLSNLGVPSLSVDVSAVPAVNLRWVSPWGFDAEPNKGRVRLSLEKHHHRHLVAAKEEGSASKYFDVGRGPDENLIAFLRPYRSAELEVSATSDAQIELRLLAGLACAGVPVSFLNGRVRESPVAASEVEVRSKYESLGSIDIDNDLARQNWSVGIRRWAISRFSQRNVWLEMTRDAESETAPAVSVVIPSQRIQYVGGIVRQALKQSFKNLEIIVGLHGIPAEQLLRQEPWLKNESAVRIYEFDLSLNLGQVLNRLTEFSDGYTIAKMDDDDLYTEHHIADLLAAQEFSGAELVGCKAEFVYLEDSDETIQTRPHSEQFDRSVTGGTLLLPRHVVKDLGGWSNVGTAEDRLIQASVRKAGGKVYRSHGLNYLMRRGDGKRIHTWNPDQEIFSKQAINTWPGLGYPGWRTSGHE